MNPRIQYRKVEEDSMLRQQLMKALSSEEIENLFYHGAVYCNGVRRRQDSPVKAGDTLRIHTEPKKFLAPGATWIPEVLFQDDDLLIIDKPGGLPTHPTLDNYNENAKVLGEKFFGHPLYVTHRLDIPTAGVLLMTKTAAAQKGINKLFAKRKIEKIYRAEVENPVEEGEYIHYLNPFSKTPKEISAEPRAGWLECRMTVKHRDPSGLKLEIVLQTGRTHQIRAQLRALGSPILGDSTYGAHCPMGPQDLRFVSASIGLECYRLSFTFRSKTYSISRNEFPNPHCP